MHLFNHSGLVSLVHLFRANWRSVGFTYVLFNAENLLQLAQPFVLGIAINDLMANSSRGLLLLAIQHACWLFIGTGRRLYDTRVFTTIYTKMALQLVHQQRRAGVDLSTVAARSALSRELVDFFEYDLKGIFLSVYGVIGAIGFLAWYDVMTALFCVLTLVPLVYLNQRLARRSGGLNRALNDQLEREVEVIQTAQTSELQQHYQQLANWRVRLSDLGAWNFFQMEGVIIALIMASLARYCMLPGVKAGDIYAVFSYLLMFIRGLDLVPLVVQQVARLNDIGCRVQHTPGPAVAELPNSY